MGHSVQSTAEGDIGPQQRILLAVGAVQVGRVQAFNSRREQVSEGGDMLTDEQKRIAWDAFYAAMNTGELTLRRCAYAALEAVIALEQPRAAEQGIVNRKWPTSDDEQPAQPPARDAQMVERMAVAGRNAVDTCSVGNMLNEGWTQAMAAALAVAREERDAQWEKAILADGISTSGMREDMVRRVRARLAKPERTDEQKVEAILTKHFHHIGVVDAAAEIVSALKADTK